MQEAREKRHLLPVLLMTEYQAVQLSHRSHSVHIEDRNAYRGRKTFCGRPITDEAIPIETLIIPQVRQCLGACHRYWRYREQTGQDSVRVMAAQNSGQRLEINRIRNEGVPGTDGATAVALALHFSLREGVARPEGRGYATGRRSAPIPQCTCGTDSRYWDHSSDGCTWLGP